MKYRLWVNEDSTVLVRLWQTGACEVATRKSRDHTWGPPVYLTEQQMPPAEAEPPPDLSESLE